ncbi:MAG: prepilin peptidase [Clostridia bacterium]|nr:prepilin peptidase [Clostridia bacterium]
MQPLNYLNTPAGLVWVILCIPSGVALTALGYLIINRIPAKWLCDYNETPSEELLSGRRVSFFPSGIPLAVIMAVCLALCRLQFNKGFDIYFIILALVVFDCMLITIADLKYQIIPDQFTVILGILAAGISVYDIVRGFHILHGAWWSPLAGAGIGAAAMIVIDLIGMLVYKRDGMGFGDVKLFFAVGILTGFPGTIYTFIISIITATIFFVAVIIISKIVRGQSDSAGIEESENDTKPKEASEMQPEEKTSVPATETITAKSDESSGSETNGTDSEIEGSREPEAEDDESVGFGSYLAFGPYIAAALCVYIVLFDLVQYLANMYLSLFN